MKNYGGGDGGLFGNHAYSITGLQKIRNKAGNMYYLVRIRNPWGNGKEWKGAWSDKSSEWTDVDEFERHSAKADGEFWMSVEDFVKHFKLLEICHLSNQIVNQSTEVYEITTKQIEKKLLPWSEDEVHGSWSRRKQTAGGSQSTNTFFNNPQYLVEISVSKENLNHYGETNVIVALLQKNQREMNDSGNEMGFAVYKNVTDGRPLNGEILNGLTPIAHMGHSVSAFRQKSLRLQAKPGAYLIVPALKEKNIEAEFLLRVYVNGKVKIRCIRG